MEVWLTFFFPPSFFKLVKLRTMYLVFLSLPFLFNFLSLSLSNIQHTFSTLHSCLHILTHMKTKSTKKILRLWVGGMSLFLFLDNFSRMRINFQQGPRPVTGLRAIFRGFLSGKGLLKWWMHVFVLHYVLAFVCICCFSCSFAGEKIFLFLFL